MQQQSFANRSLICRVRPTMRARFWHPLALQTQLPSGSSAVTASRRCCMQLACLFFPTVAQNRARARPRRAAATNERAAGAPVFRHFPPFLKDSVYRDVIIGTIIECTIELRAQWFAVILRLQTLVNSHPSSLMQPGKTGLWENRSQGSL